MIRKLRISTKPTPEPSKFDWTKSFDPENRNDYLELTRRIHAAFGNEAHAMLIHRSQSNEMLSIDEGQLPEQIMLCGDEDIFQDPYGNRSYGLDYEELNYREGNDFLTYSTWMEQGGIYSVVSQLSPKCDDFLEDLPILDASDKNQWVLLIAVQDGNVWNVYRQLILNPAE